MTYSYGSRRFTIGKPVSTNDLFLFIFVPVMILNMLGDRGKQIIDRYLSVIVTVWVIALLWYIIRIILFYKQKNRPDLPSVIEITDSGTLRLFHGQEMYTEIPIDQISLISDDTVNISPWKTINASQLILKAPVQGVNHIYVLPYLVGYSDLILKLLDISSDLQSKYKKSEWESIPNGINCLPLAILTFFTFKLLIVAISFTVRQLNGQNRINDLLVAWSIVPVIGTMLFWGIREAWGYVTMITFYTEKMQIARSSIWYSDVYLKDIIGIDIVPSGKDPEQCIIRTEKGIFRIPSGYMKGYPLLVQRIREFSERAPALNA